MAMVIGGVAVPSTVENRGGGYKFMRPETLRFNGRGEPVTAGYSTVEWSVDFMPKADYLWWRTTLLAGIAYKRYTSASLYDDTQTLTAYTNCVVIAPTFEKISLGYYEGVVVKIINIR